MAWATTGAVPKSISAMNAPIFSGCRVHLRLPTARSSSIVMSTLGDCIDTSFAGSPYDVVGAASRWRLPVDLGVRPYRRSVIKYLGSKRTLVPVLGEIATRVGATTAVD